MLTKPHWRARDKARSTQMRARDASRAELATNVSDGSIANRRLESRRRFVRTCGCFSSIEEVDVSAGLRPNSAARGSQPACRSRGARRWVRKASPRGPDAPYVHDLAAAQASAWRRRCAVSAPGAAWALISAHFHG